ncbi:MAG: hypothetical protein OSJ59_21230 [Lachnospiraceae bacterium]|nr:hypothetical protein [Lachnospiraceae bacterium]
MTNMLNDVFGYTSRWFTFDTIETRERRHTFRPLSRKRPKTGLGKWRRKRSKMRKESRRHNRK